MTLRVGPLLFVIALLPIVVFADPAPRDAAGLLEELVQALNSGDAASLQTFAETKCADNIPAAERAQKLGMIAERGAPFRIEQLRASSPGDAAAIVMDKNGERLSFKLEASEAAAPRMNRLLIGDPESFDAPPPRDYSAWTTLQGLAESIVADTESPAIGIALLRDGKLERAVAGVRELGATDLVTVDEPWSIGSIGKSFCSTVIALLIEEGKLRFETTLKEALPDVPMNPGYEMTTLEDVMKHRGGIPEDLGFRKPEIDRILGEATAPRDIRAKYVADILSREPIGPPDSQFSYSNAGYAILAHVAERVAGVPYEDLLRRSVFEPLGMTHSYVGSETFPTERPSGHIPGPDGLRPVNMGGRMESMMTGAGGGMYLSVADVVTFGAAHLKGLRGEDGFLRAETVQRLHDGQSEGGPGGMIYACGWGIHTPPGIETFHGHNGSNGTFRAELAIFPEANLVVAAIVNRGGESEPSPSLQAVLAIAGRYAPRTSD